jgi:hypothetical protein
MLDTLHRLMRLRPDHIALLAAVALAYPAAIWAQPAPQAALAATPAAPAASTPSESLCTAHFDQLSRQLARRIVETPEASRAPLLAELNNVLRKGAVFVGHAYLESMNEEQGRAELEKAKAELERLSRSERERLAPQCDNLSNNLRKNAPGWQRLIVDKVADRRAQRMIKSAQEQQQREAKPLQR